MKYDLEVTSLKTNIFSQTLSIFVSKQPSTELSNEKDLIYSKY